MLFKISEGTAARRRTYLYLVDATDGITPETGEAGGQPQFSKNGAAWGNTSATLTAVGNGKYYVEHTSGELDTNGTLSVRYKSANTAEFSITHQVVTADLFAAALAANLTQWAGGTPDGLSSGKVPVDVKLWLTSAPNALNFGRVDSHMGTIANNAITASAIASGAITNAKFAAGAIDNAAIAANAIAATNIANNALTAAKIATDAFGAAQAAADFIDEILDETFEGSETLRQYLRLTSSVLYRKWTGLTGASPAARDAADSKNRVAYTLGATRTTVLDAS